MGGPKDFHISSGTFADRPSGVCHINPFPGLIITQHGDIAIPDHIGPFTDGSPTFRQSNTMAYP